MTKFYFGKACAKHPELKGERYLSGQCRQCNKDASRERYSANPKRAKELGRIWRSKNKWRFDWYRVYFGKVCKKHPELNGERHSCSQCRLCEAERKATPASKLAQGKRSRKYYLLNTEKVKERTKQWEKENPEFTRMRKREVARKFWKENPQLARMQSRERQRAQLVKKRLDSRTSL